MNRIFYYIRNYDFKNKINKIKNSVVLEDVDYHKYEAFSKKFWENASSDLIQLKKEYSIDNNFSYKKIISLFPTEKYINLIYSCWNDIDTNTYLLTKEYKITIERIKDLLFPIEFENLDCLCPECQNHKFYIYNTLTDTIKYKVICAKCNSTVNMFFSKDYAEKLYEFRTEINIIQDQINNVKCIKCRGKLELEFYKGTLDYKFKCLKCGSISHENNYSKLIEDNKKFKINSREKSYSNKHVNKEIQNLESISKQAIVPPEIVYSVFKKQNFTCYECGRSDRALKISFLNSAKNNNNLISIIGVCDICYNELSIHEGLINEIIKTEINEQKFISWEFLNQYIPKKDIRDYYYSKNIELVSKYGEEALIKAYAIALYKFYKNDGKGNFMAYSEGILKYQGQVFTIASNIERYYRVNNWIEKLYE